MSLRTPSRIVGLALVLALGACAPGTPPVTLTISPSGPVEVRLDGSASFTVAPATVGIVWSVNGIPGGDTFVGTVSASGTYTAPYRLLYGDSVQVTATEGTRSVSATANLIAGGTMYLGDTTVHAYHDADLTDGNVAPDRSFTLQGVTGKLYDMVIVPELDLAFMNFDAAPRIHRVASISTADGVVTDFVTFSDGFFNSPSGIAYDAGRDLLYVLLNGALLVFEEASTAPDGATAARVVAGGNTGVFTVDIDGRLALDAAADRLFISDPNGEVAVYDTASTIDGNVAPDRVFSVASSTSFLTIVWGLSYDAGRDELYVGNQSARVGVHVVANASTVTGNVTPSRSIGGPTNPLYEPSTVTYDARHDRLALVITAVEGYAVYDDASTVDGDVAPDRVVRGSLVPIGYPFGGVLDPTR